MRRKNRVKSFSQSPKRTPSRFARTLPLVAVCTVLVSGMGHAADDDSVAQLQAEVARLKQALAKSQQELAAQKASQSGQPAGNSGGDQAPPVAAAPADQSAENTSNLSKVVVQAPNRLAPLKDVPLSVSVVTGDQLAQTDEFDIGAITKRAADVTWNQGNQRTSSLSIRGIGYITQNEAQAPSVGVLVDGVPYLFNPLTSSYNFSDIDTVQVTRGPQGTLGGMNNTLGNILVTTKRPTFTPDSEYLFSYGQRDTFIGQFAVSDAIIDNLLAFRASISEEKGEGDINNIYATDQTFQNVDRTTGRIQFLFTPNEDFTARLSANVTPRAGEYTNNRTFNTPTPTTYADGTPNTSLTNDARLARSWFTQNPNYSYSKNYLSTTAVDIDGGYPVVTGTNGASLQLDWNLGSYSLTSISAWQNYHFNARNDEGTAFAISTTGGVYDNNYDQLTQEFRVNSTIGHIADVQAGIFLARTNTNYESFSNWLQDAGAWYASAAQYAKLDANGNGKYLMENTLNAMWKDTTQLIQNQSAAIFGSIDWHISAPLTLTTGARLSNEDRKNSSESYLYDEGNGSALNPVAVNGVQLGGFATNGKTGALLATDSAAEIGLANAVAEQYFNVPAYAALTAAEQKQVAAAQALRKTQIGVLWNDVTAQPFRKTMPTLFFGPSYKLTNNETAYVTYQHGEKAGVAQVVNGVSSPVKPERSDAYELGLKSVLLDKTLVLNADVFLENIRDYQQTVQVFDAYTTSVQANGTNYYTTATGNAPWVQSKGFELDSLYFGIPHVTLRLNGSYVDAFYKSYTNSPKPVEDADQTNPYRSVTGFALPGAARVTGDFGYEYRTSLPVFRAAQFHLGGDTRYTSRYNTDTALSSYGWVPGGSITDADIGVGTADRKFDFSFVVKNLTNNDIPVVRTWNSFQPAFKRWFGLQVNGKLW